LDINETEVIEEEFVMAEQTNDSPPNEEIVGAVEEQPIREEVLETQYFTTTSSANTNTNNYC
jgi:hypothetical protein